MAGRALLFLVALIVVGAVCRRVQQWLPLRGPYWLLPTIAAGLVLYVRARRWTGGRELRRRIRLDLEANAAVVHRVLVQDAILFEEPHSRRFLGLKRLGEPFRPFTDRPPLSRDQFTQLGLSSVGRWQCLEVPFDDLRQVA